MNTKRLIVWLAVLALLSGCSAPASDPTTQPTQTQVPTQTVAPATAGFDPSELFTSRDKDSTYSKAESVIIQLNGEHAESTGTSVQISGTNVTITSEGTYFLQGSLNDGCITIDAPKEDKIQLVLGNVSIHCEVGAPLYVKQADKVFITLPDSTKNTLSSGEILTSEDDSNIDGVIFSKEDITLNGSGTLSLTSSSGHGIVSKDELTVTGGNYVITCASHGLSAKDSIAITDAEFSISAGKDGIHTENNDEETLGHVYIESGTYTITAEGDGISAASDLQIDGGTFSIITGGGSENAQQQTSDFWGGMGGMGGMGGGRPRGGGNFTSAFPSDSSEDSTSIKAIKAGDHLSINAGSFIIDSADDAIHSNSSITVNGGTFQIASGDDGFHADETLTLNTGNITITESYEGLEALDIKVNGGDINLIASDDGLNAAGGTDQSGFGGYRGKDQFGGGMGGMSSGNGSIEITGGTLYINASGDGIDANGTLSIAGGYTTVCGPTQGDTATLDYDKSAIISGGTFLGSGASGMAQTFSDSEQGVIALSVGNQQAFTEIKVIDSSGNTVISYAPELSYAVIILSSPDLKKGDIYTVYVGTQSGEFEAS